MITEHQYQRLMKTQQDPPNVRQAAMKAGMHRHTATKYLRQGTARVSRPNREHGGAPIR